MDEEKIINKTMDLEDLKSGRALQLIDELNDLINKLRSENLKISSWYGSFNLSGDPLSNERINRGYGYQSIGGAADDKNFPWFLYWEIVWVVLNNDFKQGQEVLDLGGSSSLFSYYLASKGIKVTAIDLQKELVDNANHVAKQMNWNLENRVMDMRALDFNSTFHHITSICVFEHIPMYDRVIINEKIRNLLTKDGKFSITFDYRNPSKFAQINSPRDVYEQFVRPSGLKIRGNKEFADNGKNYLLHPFYSKKRLWNYKRISIQKGHFKPWDFFKTKSTNDYTFGALFLER